MSNNHHQREIERGGERERERWQNIECSTGSKGDDSFVMNVVNVNGT